VVVLKNEMKIGVYITFSKNEMKIPCNMAKNEMKTLAILVLLLFIFVFMMLYSNCAASWW